MNAARRGLRAPRIGLDLTAPALMGIVNASPDSFSDGGERGALSEQIELAGEHVAAGAAVIDVGGESGVTNRPPVDPREEIERVVPLIEALVAEHGVAISIDTYKPEVAAAALDAGAAIVNDSSGLADPAIADVCARHGAALVIAHRIGPPKARVPDQAFEDIGREVTEGLSARLAAAIERGVDERATLLDPGPDLGKSPAQTIELLGDLAPVRALGRPLLLALSRKDFIGALIRARPRARLAGTLAAIAHCLDDGGAGTLLRVHDVRAAADFLSVRAALRGDAGVPGDLALPERLRRERQPPPGA